MQLVSKEQLHKCVSACVHCTGQVSNNSYRMMTSYIKGTARVVNRVPTLQLGQVR